jgi:ABC-type dipeptide/oligopeptide/nickel transport system ATPase component
MSEYTDSLFQRWVGIQKIHTRLQESFSETKIDRDKVEKEHFNNLESLDKLNRAIEYTKMIMSLVTKQELKPLEDLLTHGLQTIFHPGYSVTIEIDDRGKDKTAEFMVHQLNDTGIVEITTARETGFGIQTSLSLILQVFYLMYENGYPILLWDEPLTQVSDGHIDNVFSLIKEMILEAGIDILGVTHDHRLLEFGDKIYDMSNGKLTLKTERIDAI